MWKMSQNIGPGERVGLLRLQADGNRTKLDHFGATKVGTALAGIRD